jgi:hypothetical protein
MQQRFEESGDKKLRSSSDEESASAGPEDPVGGTSRLLKKSLVSEVGL